MAADTLDFLFAATAGGSPTKTFCLPLAKLDGLGGPGAGDDDADGYAKGSLWVFEAGGKAYVCVKNTTNAALWSEIFRNAAWYRAADSATWSNVMANMARMNFDIGANETWAVEFNLLVTGSGAGIKFQLTGPASPANVRIWTHGNTTGVTASSVDTQTAYSTPTQAYCAGAFTGCVTVRALIENGANAGTVQLQFAATTNTQTQTVLRGHHFTARRVD